MELREYTFENYPGERFVVMSRHELIEVGSVGLRARRLLSVFKWIGNTPVLRDGSHGAYTPDTQVTDKPEKSGGSVDYYKARIKNPTTKEQAPYTAECNDIIEALGMNYAEGNAFKATWRACAERTLGKKKAGGDALYSEWLYVLLTLLGATWEKEMKLSMNNQRSEHSVFADKVYAAMETGNTAQARTLVHEYEAEYPEAAKLLRAKLVKEYGVRL